MGCISDYTDSSSFPTLFNNSQGENVSKAII